MQGAGKKAACISLKTHQYQLHNSNKSTELWDIMDLMYRNCRKIEEKAVPIVTIIFLMLHSSPRALVMVEGSRSLYIYR